MKNKLLFCFSFILLPLIGYSAPFNQAKVGTPNYNKFRAEIKNSISRPIPKTKEVNYNLVLPGLYIGNQKSSERAAKIGMSHVLCIRKKYVKPKKVIFKALNLSDVASQPLLRYFRTYSTNIPHGLLDECGLDEE